MTHFNYTSILSLYVYDVILSSIILEGINDFMMNQDYSMRKFLIN